MSRLLSGYNWSAFSSGEVRDAVRQAHLRGTEAANNDFHAMLSRGETPTQETWLRPWILEYQRHCVDPGNLFPEDTAQWVRQSLRKCCWSEITNDPRVIYFSGAYDASRVSILQIPEPYATLGAEVALFLPLWTAIHRQFETGGIPFTQLWSTGYRYFSARILKTYLADTKYREVIL